jgi:hypothetical protein
MPKDLKRVLLHRMLVFLSVFGLPWITAAEPAALVQTPSLITVTMALISNQESP